jgi:hypothetical protein
MPEPTSGQQQRQPKPEPSSPAEQRANAVKARLLDRTREFIRSIAAQMGVRRRNMDRMDGRS